MCVYVCVYIYLFFYKKLFSYLWLSIGYLKKYNTLSDNNQ